MSGCPPVRRVLNQPADWPTDAGTSAYRPLPPSAAPSPRRSALAPALPALARSRPAPESRRRSLRARSACPLPPPPSHDRLRPSSPAPPASLRAAARALPLASPGLRERGRLPLAWRPPSAPWRAAVVAGKTGTTKLPGSRRRRPVRPQAAPTALTAPRCSLTRCEGTSTAVLRQPGTRGAAHARARAAQRAATHWAGRVQEPGTALPPHAAPATVWE